MPESDGWLQGIKLFNERFCLKTLEDACASGSKEGVEMRGESGCGLSKQDGVGKSHFGVIRAF